MEIGFEAFRGLTIGRLELLNCASLQNIDDSAFLSARIQALAISDSRLEKITKVGRTCIPVIYIFAPLIIVAGLGLNSVSQLFSTCYPK